MADRDAAGNAGGARYLRYRDDSVSAPGLNHQLRNLLCLLREARALGRLAVLPRLRLSAAHNFGVTRDWRWETYFDLDASVLVEPDGAERPLPLAAAAPPGAAPWGLGPGDALPAHAANRMLVERQVADAVHARDVPARAGPAPTFRVRPSARVLAPARAATAMLVARAGSYAAVHVRRGDRLFGPMRVLTAPRAIRRRLRRLGVADGQTVFFLSDEREPACWRELAAFYDVARHANFPELAALAAASPPDNYLLYEAEKEVMRGAAVRVETFPGPEYEAADATLVAESVWAASRWARRRVHAALRLARRALGEDAWRAARMARDALGRDADGSGRAAGRSG